MSVKVVCKNNNDKTLWTPDKGHLSIEMQVVVVSTRLLEQCDGTVN